MKIVVALPPNIDELDHVFGVRKMLETRAVWFCWGDTIYNPRDTVIPPETIAHERIHSAQQRMEAAGQAGIERWWGKYIGDPAFRLAQEVHAHAAEFEYVARRSINDRAPKGFRSAREWHLAQIALRLASPLYGGLVTLSEAKRLILKQAEFIH